MQGEKLETCFKKKDRAPMGPQSFILHTDNGNGHRYRGPLLGHPLLCTPLLRPTICSALAGAGRRDGNALNIAVANARPHDLYFFAEPRRYDCR